jgi:hypothetical protein
VCPAGLFDFCHSLCDLGRDGIREHWRIVEELGIKMLFPCEYSSASDWSDAFDAIEADMMRYYRRNEAPS